MERNSHPPQLAWGSALSIFAALGLLATSRAIAFRNNPGAISPLGRHLYIGGLATMALSLLLAVVAAIPLRRGEKWAFWSYAVALAIFALPAIAIDTISVPRDALFKTLAPQIAGLGVAAVGLALCGLELYGRRS